jgi:hypothetical protein
MNNKLIAEKGMYFFIDIRPSIYAGLPNTTAASEAKTPTEGIKPALHHFRCCAL